MNSPKSLLSLKKKAFGKFRGNRILIFYKRWLKSQPSLFFTQVRSLFKCSFYHQNHSAVATSPVRALLQLYNSEIWPDRSLSRACNVEIVNNCWENMDSTPATGGDRVPWHLRKGKTGIQRDEKILLISKTNSDRTVLSVSRPVLKNCFHFESVSNPILSTDRLFSLKNTPKTTPVLSLSNSSAANQERVFDFRCCRSTIQAVVALFRWRGWVVQELIAKDLLRRHTGLKRRSTDCITCSFEQEIHAQPPNDCLPIFNRAIINTNDLKRRGIVMDGSTNDTSFQLIYSDGWDMARHVSGGSLFGSGYNYTSRGSFGMVRTDMVSYKCQSLVL